MNVLLLGGTGYMGPHVVAELSRDHHLRVTDIHPASEQLRRDHPDHEYFDVDITQPDQVLSAAEGMDAIINLAVVRTHPVLAFQVNALGCYHVMEAAARHGIRRIINTGPHFTIAGPSYEDLDFAISPDCPPHPGVGLYPLTKSLGQEISRILAEEREIWVIDLLFYILRKPEELEPGMGGIPFLVSWADAARAFRRALEVDLRRLPSRCEVFFILGNLPQQKFLLEKARRILGFEPQDDVTLAWHQAADAAASP